MSSQELTKNIIVSGMRPTGKLHLGHYHGVIANWVQQQNDARFAGLYVFVADYHALTTEYENADVIRASVKDIVLDWLACGLDPEKATCFVQSAVPEHAELHLLLSMITPNGWLERVPSYKDLQRELTTRDLSTYGFLGYPVLQTADVAIYNGTHVPVGQDQVAHIELSREIVRRFNHVTKTATLVEPQPLLTSVPKLPGTDGRKMSKSYNNSIFLSDSGEDIRKKIMPMTTDPARMRRTDPGDPEKCPVFDYHKIYATAATRSEVTEGCTQAKIGCVDCKKKLLEFLIPFHEPFSAKRAALALKPQIVEEAIRCGNKKAQNVARQTLERAKQAMGLS